MLRAVALLLIVSSPAMADVIDLSKPQNQGFGSVVDLRGIANVRPHEATPAEPVAPVQIAAPIPVRAAAIPAMPVAQPQPSQAQSKPTRVVYVGYGNNADAERPAKPRRSFRLGRRR